MPNSSKKVGGWVSSPAIDAAAAEYAKQKTAALSNAFHPTATVPEQGMPTNSPYNIPDPENTKASSPAPITYEHAPPQEDPRERALKEAFMNGGKLSPQDAAGYNK